MIIIGKSHVVSIKQNSCYVKLRETLNLNSKSKRYLHLLKINQIVSYLSTKNINKINKRYQLRFCFKFI